MFVISSKSLPIYNPIYLHKRLLNDIRKASTPAGLCARLIITSKLLIDAILIIANDRSIGASLDCARLLTIIFTTGLFYFLFELFIRLIELLLMLLVDEF